MLPSGCWILSLPRMFACPCAALKERIGRLLAAVLPVATSGREARSSSSGGFAKPTTISIRNRTSEPEVPAATDGKKKGAQGGAGWGGSVAWGTSWHNVPWTFMAFLRYWHTATVESIPPTSSSCGHHRDRPAPGPVGAHGRSLSIAACFHTSQCLPFPPPAATIVTDLHPDPSAPTAAAYPSTLPAAAALFGTPEAARYSHFLEQLQVGCSATYQPDLQKWVAGGLHLSVFCPVPVLRWPLAAFIHPPAFVFPKLPQAAAWQDEEAAQGGAGGTGASAGGEAAAAAEDPAAELGGLPSLLQLTGLLAGRGLAPGCLCFSETWEREAPASLSAHQVCMPPSTTAICA